MKTYKKFGFGLLIAVAAVTAVFFAAGTKVANAATGGPGGGGTNTLSTADLNNATYKLVIQSQKLVGIEGTIAGSTVDFVDSDPFGGPQNFKPKGSLFCDGTVYGQNSVNDKLKGITVSTSLFDLVSSGTANATANLDYTSISGDCLNYQSALTFTRQSDGTYLAKQIDTASVGVNNTSSGSCDSNFVSPFSWIVCPALNLADGAIGAAYGQVERQLCFNTGTVSSTSGVICNGPNALIDGVKNAWNIFKNIASALLVIAMLVMVISQAIGGGPFGAYTIRKMLPKLVIAVIIMQLSYLLLKWAIDISNDAGSAIGSLMMAPFGGPQNMNLADMIGHNVTVATGSTGGQVAFNLFGTLAGVAGLVYVIPALPLLALYVLTGVFIAFFVLVLRKLLIIMLVMLAPVALVAWVLPGTERYWKLWKDNLVKLLAMFPLIMGMLAAGRIFAYITSTAGNSASMFSPRLAVAHLGPVPVPYVASVTGFADLAIIIGAFFAPYFLLPKTFSWGGQMLGAAGRAVENYTNKGTEAPKKLLQSRQESYRALRKLKSQERVAGGQDNFRSWNPLKWGSATVDKVRSGKWDPTLGRPRFIAGGSKRRQAAIDSYVHSGEETYQKDIEAARSRVLREGQAIRARGGNWDRYFQMVADGEKTYIDPALIKKDSAGNVIDDGRVNIGRRSEVEQDAARKQTAILGSAPNWRYLEDYYQRSTATPEQEEEMRKSGRGALVMGSQEKIRARKFFDDNVSTIMPKMPHFYQGYTAASDATGSTLAGQHGVEVESILAKYSDDIKRSTAIINDPTTSEESRKDAQGARANAQNRLLTYLRNFQAAANNPNINLDNGALRAVKGFLDKDGGASFRGEINNPKSPDGRQARGMPAVQVYENIGMTPEARAQIDVIRDSLSPMIASDTGTITRHEGGEITVEHMEPSGPQAGTTVTPTSKWGASQEFPPEPLPPRSENPTDNNDGQQ